MGTKKNLDKEKQFADARKELVVKRVDSIQLGRNSFTLVEAKAVNYMISKIKPTDNPLTEYQFNIGEFCRMIQWHRTPTNELLEMLKNLAQKAWWVKDEDRKEYELRHWFDVVRLNEKKGTITITFSQTVYPYLFNLLEQQKKEKIYLASWTADAIALMKNKFAPRIFELLRSYEYNNETWEFENGTGTERDLQVIIADRDKNGMPEIPKSWSNWSYFCRDVLEPAKKEINRYTDLMIDYEGQKTDFAGTKFRKNVRIVFRMDEKTEEEKQKKDHELAVEYDNVIAEQDFSQMSLMDYIDGKGSFEERREMVHRMEDEKKREERYRRSRHPAFLEEMEEAGFEEKWINTLYKKAQQKFFPYADIVGSDLEELWICDYVQMHLNSMRASGTKTVVNDGARLYNLVEADYKNYALQVTQKYDIGSRLQQPEQTPEEKPSMEELITEISEEDFEKMLLDKI